MLTKQDLQKAVAETINNYPSIAPYYHAKDPRIMQGLDAMATMLAMVSAQNEIAQSEPFEKVRDATVLADAAMRGIIRRAVPAKVRITAANDNATSYTISVGVVLFDSNGNPYRVHTPVTVPAGGTGSFDAVQVKSEALPSHTISNTEPFYPIKIPDSTDDSFLSGIEVSDTLGEIEYRERYINTGIGERVYNIEADDNQSIYVRFGYDGVVGYQPANGEIITITVKRSVGEISLPPDSPFTFETVDSESANVELTLSEVLDKGRNPPSMAVMRELIKYPSIYDHDAVFLGEFDFLVRRKYYDAQFLSVWNEMLEEQARGPSVDHINTLFVAVFSATGNEQKLVEVSYNNPVSPQKIDNGSLTATQEGIKQLINGADNSYRVVFMTPVESRITMSIDVLVSTAYVPSDIESQVRGVILGEFGKTSKFAKKSSNRPLYKRIYEVLRKKIAALNEVDSDIRVTITDSGDRYRPELWRYVHEDTLLVNVSAVNLKAQSWGD